MSFDYSLNLDFAEVSAGGGDVLDNFDFDSFLSTNEVDKGFEDIAFDNDPEARDTEMHSVSAQPSPIPLDAVAGALGAEAFRRARSPSRSTKGRSRSRSRSRRLSQETLRRRRSHRLRSPSKSRARSEPPAEQLSDPAAAAAAVVRGTKRMFHRESQNAINARNAKQRSLKRSRSNAFPSYTEHTAFGPSSTVSSSDASRKTCRTSVQGTGFAGDDDMDEVPLDNPSALQALLDRWLDASATAVLLESLW
jgi:hypothetical protein